MNRCLALFLFFMVKFVVCHGQVYLGPGKNRFTFAQTTIGYNMDVSSPSGYSYHYLNGILQKYKLSGNITPVITITGLHFWGRVEFFTGFALPSINLERNAPYSFSRSAGTGFKLFPFQIREKTLRPFVGSSISSFSFKYRDGTTYKRIEFPWLMGLTYSFKHGLLELGANYYHVKTRNYFLTKTDAVRLSVPPLAFSIDYKYFFDVSKGSYKQALSGQTKALFEKLKASKNLSSFSIAAGPAYSFFLANSSYNQAVRPYLDEYKISTIFPDLGIGYYWFNLDAAVNFSCRSFQTDLKAFDIHQSVNRKSVALEAFKFFGDYHGFVPFAGPVISREHIRIRETAGANLVINQSHDFWSAGIILGWDVRPTKVDWWGVRTNIRYFPWLQVAMPSGHEIDFQQIEVNFLQLVLYPNRLAGTMK